MWTTRGWKVTLLCGWLAAPLAGARSQEPDVAEAYTEAAPDEMGGPMDPFFIEPRLRYAEPLSCPAVPEGRVWVADTEECGDTECLRKTTVWIGSWTVEDEELEVRCETDRVVLTTRDWQWVLEPDATGALDVADATPDEPEAPPSELTGGAPTTPTSET